MNTPISVGLIGLGRHGSRYLRHLMEEETGGQLVAMSRKQMEEGRRQATHYQVQFFSDYHDLIPSPDIKAVLVVTPPALNLPIALKAIQHGKAVLFRKTVRVKFWGRKAYRRSGQGRGRPPHDRSYLAIRSSHSKNSRHGLTHW